MLIDFILDSFDGDFENFNWLLIGEFKNKITGRRGETEFCRKEFNTCRNCNWGSYHPAKDALKKIISCDPLIPVYHCCNQWLGFVKSSFKKSSISQLVSLCQDE